MRISDCGLEFALPGQRERCAARRCNEMVTDQNIIDLKQAYTLWQSLDIVVEYGPLRSYAEQDAMQRLWSEPIGPAVTLVQENSRRTGPGAHTTDAPSPWHAYFYLRAQQQYVYRAGRPLG